MRRLGFSFFQTNRLQLTQKITKGELLSVTEASIENYFKSCPPTLPVWWHDLDHEQKLQCALVESTFNSAEIAYYHGLACQKLPREYDGHAAYAFEQAKKLDPNLTAVCDKKIAEIGSLISLLTEFYKPLPAPSFKPCHDTEDSPTYTRLLRCYREIRSCYVSFIDAITRASENQSPPTVDKYGTHFHFQKTDTSDPIYFHNAFRAAIKAYQKEERYCYSVTFGPDLLERFQSYVKNIAKMQEEIRGRLREFEFHQLTPYEQKLTLYINELDDLIHFSRYRPTTSTGVAGYRDALFSTKPEIRDKKQTTALIVACLAKLHALRQENPARHDQAIQDGPGYFRTCIEHFPCWELDTAAKKKLDIESPLEQANGSNNRS